MSKYSKKGLPSNKKAVEDTKSLYEQYRQRREPWAAQAKEDKEFRLGRQWTKDQIKTLEVLLGRIQIERLPMSLVIYYHTYMMYLMVEMSFVMWLTIITLLV